MENIPINMGERIREMRKSKGLNQETLSQAMGVSIQAVSKWETGQSLPDVTLLPVLADYFDISIDALFGRKAEPEQQSADGNRIESSSPFPDDGKLRVVQYQGARLLSAEECAGDRVIRLCFGEQPSGGAQAVKIEIEIQGSARISGPVNGALNVAKDAYVDGDINGAANVQGDLTCEGNVNGSVRSGGNFTARGTTATIRMEGMKSSLSGLGGMISGMFSNLRTGNAAGAKMNAFFSGELPDDDVIRIVQMQGRRIMSAEESSGQRMIQLSVDHLTDPLNVEIYGSAQIEGDIRGNATSGDSMSCGNIGGSASVGDGLTCGEIRGSASAGDAIRCGNIGGNATAGDGITCGTVGGSVRAGDSAHITGDVGGSVTASDSVTCSAIHGNVKADSVRYTGTKSARSQSGQPLPDVSSFADGALHIIQVMNGEILSSVEAGDGQAICLNLEDADGITVHVHGNAQIDGDIEGDVHADGSVTCANVEGNVRAGAQVTCADVEGDVTAGGQITCVDVEGDVSAGMDVTCATVEGDVNVQGTSDRVSVTCAEIEGDLKAINASVCCNGTICGNVDLLSEKPAACSVRCGWIEGDLRAINAGIDCSGTISGSVDLRGEQPERTIVICSGIEGNVAVLNASVNCGDGSICGDVDVRGEQPDKCIVICGDVEGHVTLRNATLNCKDGSVSGDIDAESELFE